MSKMKFIGFIPWVTIGSIIGSFFIIPMMPKIVNALYYKNKYNTDAIMFYKQYIEKSIIINVTMPPADSKYYLNNVDEEKFPLSERFDTTYDSKQYFLFLKAYYTTFYSLDYNNSPLNIMLHQQRN